ncbi:tail fiber domain-containing protein [Dyadobacter sandarakinus]|uniref:Tail fiber domain-containing protein n=1 Tax=Dyadobacter sandarakinus TaxID=2747268 RepID=A0ABX7I2D5_9BACT|nr:tail fiber domain-containing protein [Dyadobacter sandarakinus]QRQ99681.1 tail fiber domain-containing protein [Dyadobacter sandarakinus]
MKAFTSFIFLLILAIRLHAQAPEQFSFQGVARNAGGQVVANATVAIRLSILKNTAFGEVVYRETHKPLTSSGGAFTLIVGTGTADHGQFSDIDWKAASWFLHVEADPAGGAAFVDLGTTQFLSVPYAIFSNQSNQAVHASTADKALQADKATNADKAALADKAMHADSSKEATHAVSADKFQDDKLIVLKGNYSQGESLGAGPVGSALIWYPKKAAFRAGVIDNGAWDDGNVGQGSSALGLNTKASGEFSTALGGLSVASGADAVAMGKSSIASGDFSLAGGTASEAKGQAAVAFGYQSMASKTGSVALGINANSAADYAVALGHLSRAYGENSISIGHDLYAKSEHGIAMGQFNDDQDNPSDVQPLRRLFQLGNGTAYNKRSNALTILQNGNVGLGKNALFPQYILDIDGRPRLRHNGQTAGLYFNSSQQQPNGFVGMYDDQALGIYLGNAWQFYVMENGNANLKGKLYDNSDRRLKKEITQLSNSLTSLSKLKGYHYYWKDLTKSRMIQTGVIAQEVEAILPELVLTGKDGMKSVDYLGFIPHLIEAVKDLKSQVEQLKESNKTLVDKNRRLTTQLAAGNQVPASTEQMNEIYERLINLEARLGNNAKSLSTATPFGK